MAKVRVHLTFPKALVNQPVIYYLGKNFNLITNIRRANVTEGTGWVVLEIEGAEEDIQTGIKDLEAKGIRVDPVEKDIIE